MSHDVDLRQPQLLLEVDSHQSIPFVLRSTSTLATIRSEPLEPPSPRRTWMSIVVGGVGRDAARAVERHRDREPRSPGSRSIPEAAQDLAEEEAVRVEEDAEAAPGTPARRTRGRGRSRGSGRRPSLSPFADPVNRMVTFAVTTWPFGRRKPCAAASSAAWSPEIADLRRCLMIGGTATPIVVSVASGSAANCRAARGSARRPGRSWRSDLWSASNSARSRGPTGR